MVAAVEAELAALPEELASSSAAVSALTLARSIDAVIPPGPVGLHAGLVRELRECMAELQARAARGSEPPAASEGEKESSPVADLTAIIAARGRPATR